MKRYTPAIIDGIPCEHYFVDPDGNIWSDKSKEMRKLKPSATGNNPYPRLQLKINGKNKYVQVHRVVCETFHEFSAPKGVSKKDWKSSPDSIKKLIKSLCQVNHIDHDHSNFHPSNLEWVTVKENSSKYQKHRTDGLQKNRK